MVLIYIDELGHQVMACLLFETGQDITRTNADLLSTWTLRRNFSEIWIKKHFSKKKGCKIMHF